MILNKLSIYMFASRLSDLRVDSHAYLDPWDAASMDSQEFSEWHHYPTQEHQRNEASAAIVPNQNVKKPAAAAFFL